ncbi:MAG: hypothetical protein WC250_01080 [Candidatus Paceibacterota bacterium]|jgi:hypothetical protein
MDSQAQQPFMFGFKVSVDLKEEVANSQACGGTYYTTSSGGRETEYDEDP